MTICYLFINYIMSRSYNVCALSAKKCLQEGFYSHLVSKGFFIQRISQQSVQIKIGWTQSDKDPSGNSAISAMSLMTCGVSRCRVVNKTFMIYKFWSFIRKTFLSLFNCEKDTVQSMVLPAGNNS